MWVLITAGAAIAAITSSHKTDFGWFGALGLLLWLIGFSIEAVADNQKRVFKQQKKYPQRIYPNWTMGSVTVIPNYFGEILLWIGVAVIAYPSLYQWQLVTLISPIFVILLLTKVSGISLQEKFKQTNAGQMTLIIKLIKDVPPVLIPKICSAKIKHKHVF